MERLLRELEAQLSALPPAERDYIVAALRSLISSLLRLSGRVHISKIAGAKAISDIGLSTASGKTLGQIASTWKARADAIGPSVAALFHAL